MSRFFARNKDLVLVLSTVLILLILFSPIPPAFLDLAIIVNFGFGLTIMLLTFYVRKPVEFSTFPSLLLVATLYRLSLNVAACASVARRPSVTAAAADAERERKSRLEVGMWRELERNRYRGAGRRPRAMARQCNHRRRASSGVATDLAPGAGTGAGAGETARTPPGSFRSANDCGGARVAP